MFPRSALPKTKREPASAERITCLLAGFLLALILAGAGKALAIPSETDTGQFLTAPLENLVPPVLTDHDRELYREAFALQEDGKWPAADRRIRQIQNRLLVGHLLAQRYLHPTAYRSNYRELQGWMDTYADHPDAARIYRLALHRKPRDARPPRPPVGTYITGLERVAEAAAMLRPASPEARQALHKLQATVRNHLRKGKPERAERALLDKAASRHVGTAAYDGLKADVAAGYFGKGEDEEAYTLAFASAARSGRAVPKAHWMAGLAAWRLKRPDAAGAHFEALAELEGAAAAWKAAGAYWAARNALVNRRPQNVSHWLELAAEYPQTFYGILARRALGRKANYTWNLPSLSEEDVRRIAATARGARALALLEVDQSYRAERELRGVAAEPELAEPVFALATHFQLPSLSVRLAGLFGNNAERLGGTYPIPPWVPTEGFLVDRALLYAIMHQESTFNVRAKSPAGAHGLMQLLPQTANLMVDGQPFRGTQRAQLFEPELNLSIAQKYILRLLRHAKVGGNLFLLTAAYNAGENRVARWQRNLSYDNDALLFLESIPANETRIFVKRVFRNLWIYQERLGQPTPTLDALLGGEWPIYVASNPLQEGRAFKEETEVAKYGD